MICVLYIYIFVYMFSKHHMKQESKFINQDVNVKLITSDIDHAVFVVIAMLVYCLLG